MVMLCFAAIAGCFRRLSNYARAAFARREW
jgi:hypothetical protein